MDVFPIAFTAAMLWYFHGEKIFDREELVPVLSLMAAVTFHSLMFFINFWNADINVMFCYTNFGEGGDITTASHIWVKIENKKQDTVKKIIVPVLTESVEIAPGKLQTVYNIEIMKKRMLWSNEKGAFQSIPFPIKENIEFYQTAEGINDKQDEQKALLVWGNNTMKIPIPSFIELY